MLLHSALSLHDGSGLRAYPVPNHRSPLRETSTEIAVLLACSEAVLQIDSPTPGWSAKGSIPQPKRDLPGKPSTLLLEQEITRHAESKIVPSEFLIITTTLASPLFVKAPFTFILI